MQLRGLKNEEKEALADLGAALIGAGRVPPALTEQADAVRDIASGSPPRSRRSPTPARSDEPAPPPRRHGGGRGRRGRRHAAAGRRAAGTGPPRNLTRRRPRRPARAAPPRSTGSRSRRCRRALAARRLARRSARAEARRRSARRRSTPARGRPAAVDLVALERLLLEQRRGQHVQVVAVHRHQPQRLGVGAVGDLALLVVAQALRLLRQRVVVGAHLMRGGGPAHAPLEHHRACHRGRPLEVVGGAVGDAPEHDLLGGAAAQRHLQPVLQLVGGEHMAVLLGQAHHEAERAAAGMIVTLWMSSDISRASSACPASW